MKNDIVFKNNLKEKRNQKRISQEELANMVGTTRQTIIAIEKNQFNPSAKLALLICLVLDEKFENLFYFDKKKLLKLIINSFFILIIDDLQYFQQP